MKENRRIKAFSDAKSRKKDEFYTQYTVIKEEIAFYRKQLIGKTIYLNCDDPRISNFFRYFVEEFDKLQLKCVLASGVPCASKLGQGEYDEHGVWAAYYGKEQDPDSSLPGKAALHFMEGDGDFRSDEACALLKKSDIIITNPPFSLFREFFSLVAESGRKFIILGNMNAASYKEVFPYFKNNLVWYGPSIHSGDREFLVPIDYPLEASGCRQDIDGNRYIKVKGVRWFTNLPCEANLPQLKLTQHYSAERYPVYVNYPAIEVSRVSSIPDDYFDEMGVPISFLDHYDAEQFEIIGSSNTLALPMKDFAKPGTYQSGGSRFYLQQDGESYKRLYERIVVKRRK